MQVVILEEAKEEILLAHDWYESRRKGLGFDFELCLEVTLDRIAHFPESYPLHYNVARRALVPQFPYGVYFAILKEAVSIVAVFHLRRNPKTMKGSISRLIKKNM